MCSWSCNCLRYETSSPVNPKLSWIMGNWNSGCFHASLIWDDTAAHLTQMNRCVGWDFKLKWHPNEYLRGTILQEARLKNNRQLWRAKREGGERADLNREEIEVLPCVSMPIMMSKRVTALHSEQVGSPKSWGGRNNIRMHKRNCNIRLAREPMFSKTL